MFKLKNVLVSEDILDHDFACNLSDCKGACCVAGEAGAPVAPDEIPKLEEIQDKISPFLREEGREAISEQGVAVKNDFEEWETPLVNGEECAYAVFTEDGTALCGIEKAYRAGEIDWKKPVSCELYPIRVQKLHEKEVLNYHRWSVCDPACKLGKELQMPIYKFTKEPLIKKYGKDWYHQLETYAEHHQNED